MWLNGGRNKRCGQKRCIKEVCDKICSIRISGAYIGGSTKSVHVGYWAMGECWCGILTREIVVLR